MTINNGKPSNLLIMNKLGTIITKVNYFRPLITAIYIFVCEELPMLAFLITLMISKKRSARKTGNIFSFEQDEDDLYKANMDSSVLIVDEDNSRSQRLSQSNVSYSGTISPIHVIEDASPSTYNKRRES